MPSEISQIFWKKDKSSNFRNSLLCTKYAHSVVWQRSPFRMQMCKKTREGENEREGERGREGDMIKLIMLPEKFVW